MKREQFERDFHEALRCGLGPAKLSAALAKILPLIKEQRDLGAGWQQISDCLSAVLEAQGRPRISAATLRGLVRRLNASKHTPARNVRAPKVPRPPQPVRSESLDLPSPDLPADTVAALAERIQALKRLS
jgi:hypothetical protein